MDTQNANMKELQRLYDIDIEQINNIDFEKINKLYEETKGKTRYERKRYILSQMTGLFQDEESAKSYVEINIRRKIKNLIYRRIRMCRKAYLNDMNYLCTFTYDDKLHTEESFEKTLKKCLQNFSVRKGWKYMGVWEISPNERLHFHGLLYIPEDGMVGELKVRKDYSTKQHKMQETTYNTFFEKRFGRNDFREII